MKNQIQTTAIALLLCMFTFFTRAQSQTVNIALTLPPDTIGACESNVYSLSLSGATGARIVITASLSNAPAANCSNASPIYLDFIIASNNVSNVVTYNNGQTMSFTVTNNNAVTLSYHAFIDCSVISGAPQGNSNINFVQTFTDSSATNYTLSVNNQGSMHTSLNVQIPTLVALSSNLNQVAYYKTDSFLYFYYQNTGTTKLNFNFTFTPDATNYCQRITTGQPEYNIGLNGNFAATAPGTAAVLNIGDTLVIRQAVQANECLDKAPACGPVTSQLQWTCNNNIPSNIFCTNCSNGITVNYYINSGDAPVVKIERLAPADSLYDFSCMNDTVNFVHWQYRVTNSGMGAIDSLFFNINQSFPTLNNALPNYSALSLIPFPSFSWHQNTGSLCTVAVDTVHRSDWLCKNLVADALFEAAFKIKNFGNTDTVIIAFNTLRCSEEDTNLFNVQKNYNHWAFNSVKGRKVCGDGVSADYNIGLANTTSISTHASGGSADVSQNLIFSPTVTDLSVAPGATFGDSALLKVRLKGLLPSPYDYQLYGCSVPVNNCMMNGWLRVEVHCDTNLRIAGPATHAQLVYYRITQGDTLVIKPDYVFAAVDTNLCEAGNYNYYFNMNSAGFKAFLDSAHFEFTVQACCRIDKGATPYQINFYTLPNPSNCFTLTQTTPNTLPVISDVRQQWLPLSYTGDQISVHCPGCLAPGAIVSNYKINRISFGLQDSNNDSRTDNATKIIKGYNYYNTFKNYLNENFAHYSDTLEDYLSAYFQDGDNSGTGGGYTYQQLVTAGVPLHFMQLSRIIPFGLDSFDLTIDSVVLYIDTLIPNTNACMDCADFGLTGNSIVTQSVVAFNRADAYSHCVIADVQRNQLLFTFCDTTGGNIQAFETFTNTSFPFVAFKTGQRYRLKVRYSVCGNYRLPFNSVSNLVCNSPITNNLWFTGKQQGADAIATLPQMPNTVGAMETDFHYSFNTGSGYPLPNQNFVDSARFYCETFGGRFYFVPTSYYNNSAVTNTPGCEKLITAVYIADLAGYRNRIFDVYPYEYRVPPLFADTISFQIPNGYYISLMRVRSGVYYDNNGQPMAPFSAYDTLTPPQLTGLVQIPFDSLPVMHCLQQSMSPAGNDTAAFAGDQFTRLELQCFIRRFDCSTAIDTLPLSSVYTGTGLFESECNPTENLSCTPLATAADSIPFNANIQPLLVQPNLNLVLPVSNVANAQQQQLCWTVKVLNPKVVVQPGTPDIYSTGADNVFLGVPLNGAIPALQNWQFTPTGQSTINAVNGIIPLTAHLAADDSVTGQLCATFVSCDSTINSFPLYYGWNCNGFPVATSQIPDTICGADFVTLGIEYFEASLTGEGKGYYPNNYTLCDTLKKFTCIVNSNPGYAYPDFAGLINIPPGVNILSAYILNPNTTPAAVSYLTGSAPWWQITPANMQALGFANGGIHLTDKFCVYFNLIPECAFAADTTLPDILVAGKNYCGDSLSYTAYFNYNNQSPLFMDSTACTDCWSITKTAGTDTAAAFTDTVTYTITVCNNSVNTQTGILADNTPANFVITNSTLPATVTLNSMQCDTFTISGYFTQPGSCLYNVASVTSPANTTWKDSVCVTVINACANTDTTFADSTFSGNATISNQSIYVANRFYINGNLTLNSCTVYTAAGAQIIVQNTGVLTLNNTTLQACDTMWRGIEVLANGIVTLNTSTIRDAENGILLRNKGIVKSVNSNFYDNIIGINAQPELALSDVYGFAHLTVIGTTFTKVNGFKPIYVGQPTHGTVPLSGIWLTNMFCTIGDNIFNENYLSKMEFGIYCVNSHLTLTNSRFEFISNSGSWPTKPSGTAVVSWGNSQNTMGVLDMQPLSSDGTTVQQCDRGIYSIYSELKAHNLTFRQVLTGIYAARCKLRTADITYNDIQAKSYGIYLSRNEGAKSVTIEGNTITMQGSSKGVGITLDELTNTSSANYNVYNNTIALHAAATGIKSSFALKPQINYNSINQYTVGSQKPLTTGIQLLGSDTATVTCNYIISNYPADTLLISKGMEVAQSKGFNINCNHIRFQNCGVYMGGDCQNNNVYRANDVDSCDMGLYLNTAAIIGQQMQKGNRWLNVLNKVNATNLGDPSLSPIMVHTNVNTIWHPLNISPNGPWFIPQSGTPDQCGNDCYSAFTTSEDTLLLYNIARGDTLSTEFIEETKSIAQQNLYELLVANDTLRDSDTVLTVFYINNQNTVIGKLNETKDFQKSAFVINGYFNSLLAASDSLMQQITDSLTIVDSLLKQNPTTLYQALLDNLIQQLNSQQTTRKNLMQQIENIQIGNWVGSTNANASVQPTTLPQINQKTMNELLRKAEQLGEDSLQTDMNTLLNIALQCPYSGGVSVYQARNMLALFNDSLEYDDQYACLQEGIYRMAQRGNGFTNYAAIDFDLVPNPADGKTEVRILSPVDGLTKLTLRTMLGYMMGEWQLNGEKQFTVYTHKYLQGMYMIEIKDGNGYSRVKKLIIAR